MQIILFETRQPQLEPITLTQPAFSVRCGSFCLRSLLPACVPHSGIHAIVPKHLQGVAQQLCPKPKRWETKLLFIDGSLQPDTRFFGKIATLVEHGKSFQVTVGKMIVVAFVDTQRLQLRHGAAQRLSSETVQGFLAGLKLPKAKVAAVRFEHLWDVLTAHPSLLAAQLPLRAVGLQKLKVNVFVGKQVQIHPSAVLDTTGGPIVLHNRTQVAAYAVLRGPLYIGRDCKINSFAEIKNSGIGDFCKIGGEVEDSIIQSYGNKQHYGTIAHSYVGSWVNLGAGTTNSDLKSTYGEVKMHGQPTGQQFLGCVVGSFSKTSIGTLLYTGKVVGANCNVLGAVTRDVPSFTNAGSLVKTPVEFPLDAAQRMQAAMMARRQCPVTGAHRRLLQDVYALTIAERKAAGIKKGKLELR